GVAKAYTTAVGAGPFPTELTDGQGDRLRALGGEYGATTGRPRRCGWFDAVAVRWASHVAGFTELALTKIDVLDTLPTVPLCTEYGAGAAGSGADQVEPRYLELLGWNRTTSSARSLNDLPAEARSYIQEIERRVGVPIT